MANPLESLKVLHYGETGPNDPSKIAMLRDQYISEMKRNLEFQNQDMQDARSRDVADPRHAGQHRTFGTGATNVDVQDFESDIANDPLTGLKAQAEAADFEKQGKAAQMAGFQGRGDGGYGGAIRAQQEYGRKQAEQHAQQPIVLQNLKNTGDLNVAQEETKRYQGVAETNAEANKYKADISELINMFKGNTSENVARINSQGRVGAAIGGQAQRTLNTLGEAGAAGKVDVTDPNFMKAASGAEATRNMYAPPPNAPMDVKDHIKQLIQKHHGKNAQQLLSIVEAPEAQGGEGGFDSEEDRMMFINALKSAGIR